jgi:HTH-type transcriptional regulator/antitoxin HigA
MTIKILRTKEEYETAMSYIEKYFDAEIGTKEADNVAVLAILVERYENEHFPMLPPDPVEILKFCMDQHGLKPKDLVGILGDKTIVSRVLNKERSLSISMIHKLHEKFHIPYEVLLQSTSHYEHSDKHVFSK